MPGDLTIRLATPADAAAIGEIHVAAHRLAYRGIAPDRYLDRLDPSVRAREWEEYLADPPPSLRFWLIERDGATLGFCGTHAAEHDDAATLPAPSAELHWIHLAPAHVGTGVGRALMAHAVADLRARGFRHAVLWVFAANERARRFYAAGGWSPDGAERSRTFHVDAEATTAIELRYGRSL